MPDRDQPTLADFVVLALNPVLVMTLVGSLVYFLLEVLYAGAFHSTMRWIVFFFIMAVVLITRISMTGAIAQRAGIYGVVLGLATFLAMQKFVEYPPGSPLHDWGWLSNLGLLGIIWWCAHRLTWDCTFQGQEADAGGEGLLKETGFNEAASEQRAEDESLPKPTDGGPWAWLARYRQYRAEQKKKRVQGTWVVYFSLASLPLFGLGQALIAAEEIDRRQYVYWLMVLYTSSGLGLLLTTSFLGLRRYLRQRKLHMPPAMVGVWLGMGFLLIIVLLILGTFLPRPHPEYALVNFSGGESPKVKASEHAVRGDKAGEGKGRPGGEGKDDSQNGSGRKGRSDDKDKNGKGAGGDKSKDGKGGTQKGEQEGQGSSSSREKSGGKKDQGKNGRSSPSGKPPWSPTSFLSSLAPLLKWIVFGIVALIVLFILLRHGLKFLANFCDWARRLLESLRNLFAGLFGVKQKQSARAREEEIAQQLRDRPFASFANPFHDGRARRMSVKELLCYSMAAAEAWAREQGLPRQIGETPFEFVTRLGDEFPALEAPLRRLANLFVRAVYSPEVLPDSCVELIEPVWQHLEAAGSRPLSAR